MGSSEMDKTPKEKEAKTPPPTTTQVFICMFGGFIVLYVFFYLSKINNFNFVLQEQSSTTGSGTVNPDWTGFQVFPLLGRKERRENLMGSCSIVIVICVGCCFNRHILLYLHMVSWHQAPKLTHICGGFRYL